MSTAAGDAGDAATSASRDPVRAAGGVVWRRGDTGVEVVVVHRPRYDDWSFPKGKLEPGEEFAAAARREVLEETGFVCEAGDELPPVTYTDHRGRPKVVRYWIMQVVRGEFTPNDEVDRLEWLPLTEAAQRLTYGHDAALLSTFAAGDPGR
ncbi:MAG: NUDIX hydrolase [Acidimicrobiia bacterium]|nr:NUDIX hydrolase [Acidimicrobiia bacterium]